MMRRAPASTSNRSISSDCPCSDFHHPRLEARGKQSRGRSAMGSQPTALPRPAALRRPLRNQVNIGRHTACSILVQSYLPGGQSSTCGMASRPAFPCGPSSSVSRCQNPVLNRLANLAAVSVATVGGPNSKIAAFDKHERLARMDVRPL